MLLREAVLTVIIQYDQKHLTIQMLLCIALLNKSFIGQNLVQGKKYG